MTDNDPTPDHSAALALHAACVAGSGYFADYTVAQAARRFLLAYRNHHDALETARAALTIGCPRCGAAADEWCVTNTGNRYDMGHGPAYFHAARRRVLADFEVTP